MEQLILAELEALRPTLGLAGHESLNLSAIRTRAPVADGPAIYRVADRFVLYHSPKTFPSGVGIEESALATLRQALGQALSTPMPEVLASGMIDGRRFMVVPAAREFSRWRVVRRMQLRRLRTPFFAWLRGLAGASSAPSPEARAAFLQNLGALADAQDLSLAVRSRAQAARAKVEDGGVRPRFTPMHGDLWLGNVLLPPDGWNGSPFYVIDWGGARLAGFATYDLIRAAESFGLGQSSLRRELAAHASLLGTSSQELAVFMLAALGHYAQHLGQMPWERLDSTARQCLARIDSGLR